MKTHLRQRVCTSIIFVLLFALCSLHCNDHAHADSPEARRLIVHVDDVGMCHAGNVATIQAFESGLVTSASIMMPCSWVPEFAAFAKDHPEYCYGIHLTLNSEWSGYRWGPVAGRDRVPSLVDEQGYLYDNTGLVAKNAKVEEVEIELRAQIELAKKLGIPLSHLDTHMGAVLSRPDIVEVYVKLGLEYDLPFLWLRKMNPIEKAGYPHLAARLDGVVKQMDEKKLPVLDAILQFYGGDDLARREQNYFEVIEKINPGTSLLIIHSAIEGPELEAITDSHLRRHQDFEIFSRQDVKERITNQGIELVSWKSLTEKLRNAK